MSFKFTPNGIPQVNTHAVSSSIVGYADNMPVSASYAEYSLGNIGPQGPQYIIKTAAIGQV